MRKHSRNLRNLPGYLVGLLALCLPLRGQPPGAFDPGLEWSRSFDGTYLPLHVRSPAGKGPFPAVLFLFGGLGGKAWPQGTGGVDGPVPAHFLSQGYVVCTTDFRRYHYYGHEVEDVMAAYFHLQSLPQVNRRKVAIVGGSHGGYLATMVATRITPAAVVSFSGPADIDEPFTEEAAATYERFSKDPEWREKMFRDGKTLAEVSRQLDLGIADRTKRSPSRTIEPGTEMFVDLGERMGRDRAKWRELSPMTHVEKIKAPFLYLIGDKDDNRDNVGDGRRLVERLQALGRTAEYSLHPGMGHGFYWGTRRDPDGNFPTEFYRSLERTLRFINRHLIGDEEMKKRAWRGP